MFANYEFPLVCLQEPYLEIVLIYNPPTIPIHNYSFAQNKYYPTLVSTLKNIPNMIHGMVAKC
jgi:hypothetical protein